MVQAKSTASRSSGDRQSKKQQGITAIIVQGYKALQYEERIAIAPLTLLAGANSSGKSSIMQPILLMKQTLEASYDPGALLLNGPNLKFTLAEQLFTYTSEKKTPIKKFKVGAEIDETEEITCTFQKTDQKPIDLALMECKSDISYSFFPGVEPDRIMVALPPPLRKFLENAIDTPMQLVVERHRCFFKIVVVAHQTTGWIPFRYRNPAQVLESYIQEIIHVPGLRGNPERTYKTTAIGGEFPGTFENYVASIVNDWQQNSPQKLKAIEASLQDLGLTSRLESKQINDTQVELQVGRLPCNSNAKPTKQDMVSIADVGFGVSQTLPVLVALLAANPGQLVYIEQPEIHLHPRAQVALAKVLAEAANRGVRVVVETHSELLLLGIQSLVAEGQITPDKVKLHWFTREEDGATKITSADLDETGAFGDWPEDFGEVAMATQNRYLSAAEARLWKDK